MSQQGRRSSVGGGGGGGGGGSQQQQQPPLIKFRATHIIPDRRMPSCHHFTGNFILDTNLYVTNAIVSYYHKDQRGGTLLGSPIMELQKINKEEIINVDTFKQYLLILKMQSLKNALTIFIGDGRLFRTTIMIDYLLNTIQ